MDYDDLSKHPNVAYDFVSRLHKDSIQYSEELMKSLMKLDSLVCNMQERPLRRSMVQKIQALLDMVDEINNELHDMQEKLNEKRIAEQAINNQPVQQPSQAAVSAVNDQPTVKPVQQPDNNKTAVPQPAVPQPQSPDEYEYDDAEYEEELTRAQYARLKPLWKSLRWSPRTDEQENPDSYIVRVFAPGMSTDQFDIGMDRGGVVSIRATKTPSLSDIRNLRNEARALGATDVTEQHILQLASGKYGTMNLAYTLHDDADDQRITAKYDKGVLSLIVKKRPSVRRAPAYDWYW